MRSSEPNGAGTLQRVPLSPTVVVNAGGGTSLTEGSENVAEAISAAFLSRSVNATVVVVSGDQIGPSTREALQSAKLGEVSAIVAAGGDGTVRTVAGLLAGTGIPFGVLPMGTLNHFAGDLGIPSDVQSAVDVIVEGHTREVDIAEVNGEAFVNNSSVGIYPSAVMDRDRQQARRGLPKWFAMVRAFARVLRRFRLRKLAIRVNHTTGFTRTPCLFVGNNQYELSLFALGKRHSLDSGKLWICVAKQQNPLSFIWLALRLCTGLADPAKALATFDADSADINSRTSRLPVALDGEVLFLRPPLLYRSRPGALRVFTPGPKI